MINGVQSLQYLIKLILTLTVGVAFWAVLDGFSDANYFYIITSVINTVCDHRSVGTLLIA